MLLAVVDDWNTIVEDGECNGILGQTCIGCHGRKSCLIVILEKVAQECGVLAGATQPLNVVGELCHRRGIGREGTNDPVVSSIVQHTRHVVLPSTKSGWVAVKDFTNSVDTSRRHKAWPESLVGLHGTVQTQSIDREF